MVVLQYLHIVNRTQYCILFQSPRFRVSALQTHMHELRLYPHVSCANMFLFDVDRNDKPISLNLLLDLNELVQVGLSRGRK